MQMLELLHQRLLDLIFGNEVTHSQPASFVLNSVQSGQN
jgi:hypothetical protein